MLLKILQNSQENTCSRNVQIIVQVIQGAGEEPPLSTISTLKKIHFEIILVMTKQCNAMKTEQSGFSCIDPNFKIILAYSFDKISTSKVTAIAVLLPVLLVYPSVVTDPRKSNMNIILRLTTPETKQIWDTLRDLVPFVQIKKREKYPSRSATFSEVAS